MNVSLPTMLIWRIFARLPSLMSIFSRDLVARLLLDFGLDAHAVFAAAEVLVGEVLLHLFEHRAVEGLADGEARAAQRLLQVFGLDVLVAGDLEALDRGAFQHHDDERRAVAPNLDVAEKARGIERADRLRAPRCGVIRSPMLTGR